MEKSIRISIPNPCHEDWNTMTPSEKGRFCQACSKEVIDLTQHSKTEIWNIVKGKSGICGRIAFPKAPSPITKEHPATIRIAPYAASLLVPFALMATTPSFPSPVEPLSTFTSLNIGSLHHNGGHNKIVVSGVVFDMEGKGIPGVMVRVKGTEEQVITNELGQYRITCPSKETLVFVKEQFITQERLLGTRNEAINLSLQLQSPVVEIIEIVTGDIESVEILEIEEIEEIPIVGMVVHDSDYWEETPETTKKELPENEKPKEQ
jgi:hypothetical protein